MDKKFNRYFRIHIEKLSLLNYHIKKVLKPENDHNRIFGLGHNRYIVNRVNIRNGNIRNGTQLRVNNVNNYITIGNDVFHKIAFLRYGLAFVNMKKIDIDSLIKINYNFIIANIYEKLEKNFINNCKDKEFVENIYDRQL
tara:strand:+ start:115 stop:534 length:420 start_codon:yes stop_codon:yes gene_type:complete